MSESATPDVSVRPARLGDEQEIGRIQVDAWVASLGERLGRRRHEAFDQAAITQGWAEAISQPPTPGHRVFVATCDGDIVGFTAVAPPNSIVALEVDPARRRRGHGSRLLAAAADHLRNNGGSEMKIWALDRDVVRANFLADAGFGEAGMRRELDGPGLTIPEKLWHASLVDAS
ncbi:GNAT family N-acetyltransferase [Demequina sp. TTPB684]|uniref:GNAT family N-acetyltransferase n=1 Tax=unclassified Demequina TaxID=2620311 RepID=UPI001CF358AB|nr:MULTISPECIES: GNAT family N-acetyltransferase [unclassified Demequina]MCB2413710.1 GNAT family N-acetyltransferase [Demequina sp. TTPB684]UPU89617.1 GNAT family N-acetyltransferase [Demequina sp. TMPB413]